jgi:hypothetical protein
VCGHCDGAIPDGRRRGVKYCSEHCSMLASSARARAKPENKEKMRLIQHNWRKANPEFVQTQREKQRIRYQKETYGQALEDKTLREIRTIMKGRKSSFESKVGDFLISEGVTHAYEPEKLPYVVRSNYIPDYRVITRSGKVIYIEVKGWLRPADKIKMEAVKRAHPEKDIRFVFQKDKPLYKGSKTTYSLWANKHGFMWSVKTVPTEWLNE